MGHVGDKGPLIFPGLVKLVGHIIQRGGQIAHLVLRLDGDLIVQVAGGVLGRSPGDLFQRTVHGEGKHQQNQQGQQEEHQCDEINLL